MRPNSCSLADSLCGSFCNEALAGPYLAVKKDKALSCIADCMLSWKCWAASERFRAMNRNQVTMPRHCHWAGHALKTPGEVLYAQLASQGD